MLRRSLTLLILLSLWLVGAQHVAAQAQTSLAARVSQATLSLEGAEGRFVEPPESWFAETKQTLQGAYREVEASFTELPADEVAQWRSHLHWHLLEEYLDATPGEYADLALVRRWLYSNREGLEGPRFAEVRAAIDSHLDAAFTFNQPKLRGAFEEKVSLARQQLTAIAAEPTDVNAVALGRTLDWLEKTGQLREEVEEIRGLLSQPNAQIVVSGDFAGRILQIFDTDVDDRFPVRDINRAPPSGLRQVRRTLRVRGTANTVGTTALEVAPNEEEAEIRLVFSGDVMARCTADAGPAAIHVVTSGPVIAVKPILFSAAGWTLGETTIDAPVKTRLTDITADRRIIRSIAKRQANKPESMSHMRSTAKAHTAEMLIENMDERVDEAVAEIRSELEKMRRNMDGFAEVVAPLRREGAVPELLGMQSTEDSLQVNVAGVRRNQFGALLPYQNDTVGGDLQFRVHLSFFNNSLETILGGKRLSDEFLMKYARILQAQLPLPLMVHSRSTSWAITTEKYRPLELTLVAPNRLKFTMRITSVDIADQTFEASAVATMFYDVVPNEFDEHELVRDGEVVLQADLPTDAKSFLHEKLDAFFAPRLDAGGVAVPDGGMLGALNDVEISGFSLANDWLVVGLNIPQQVFDSVWDYQQSQPADE